LFLPEIFPLNEPFHLYWVSPDAHGKRSSFPILLPVYKLSSPSKTFSAQDLFLYSIIICVKVTFIFLLARRVYAIKGVMMDFARVGCINRAAGKTLTLSVVHFKLKLPTVI